MKENDLSIDESIQKTKPEKEKVKLVADVQEKEKELHHHIDPSIEVKGLMTLSEVSRKYNVPSEYIKQKLNIPLSTSNSSKLGHLRKQYGFTMSEIELIIANYKK
jgi:LysM repeat protein